MAAFGTKTKLTLVPYFTSLYAFYRRCPSHAHSDSNLYAFNAVLGNIAFQLLDFDSLCLTQKIQYIKGNGLPFRHPVPLYANKKYKKNGGQPFFIASEH